MRRFKDPSQLSGYRTYLSSHRNSLSNCTAPHPRPNPTPDAAGLFSITALLSLWDGHTVWSPLRWLFLTHHNAFEIHTNCCWYQLLLPSYCRVAFHCLDIPIYLSGLLRDIWAILSLNYHRESCYEHLCTSFCVKVKFYLSRINTYEHQSLKFFFFCFTVLLLCPQCNLLKFLFSTLCELETCESLYETQILLKCLQGKGNGRMCREWSWPALCQLT